MYQGCQKPWRGAEAQVGAQNTKKNTPKQKKKKKIIY